MTTINMVYCNGGFGPVEHFYHECLTISEKGVEFSKKWDINLEGNENDRRYVESKLIDLGGMPGGSYYEAPTDFSWECHPLEPMLKRCAESIADILMSIFASLGTGEPPMVCDGDSMEIEVVGDGRDPLKYDVCWLGLPSQYRKSLGKELKKILPDGIELPHFLK